MSSDFTQFSTAPFQQPVPKSPRSGPKTWMIVAAVLGGLSLLGLLACGGLVYLGINGISRRPPTDEERQTLVTIDDLEPFGVEIDRQEEREIWQTKRNFDGSLEVEYEYDPERAPGLGEDIFLISSLDIDGSESSARETYGMAIAAYQLGFRLYDVTSREQPHSMAGVDQCHFAVIMNDDKPVGNMVVVRQGKRVHGLLLIGLYFEDPQELENLLRPAIESSAGIPLR